MRVHEVGHEIHLLLDRWHVLVPQMLLDKLWRLEDLASPFERNLALILGVPLLLHTVGDVERREQPLGLRIFHLHFRRKARSLLDPLLRTLHEQTLPFALLVDEIGRQNRPDVSCRPFPNHLADVVVLLPLVVAVIMHSSEVVDEKIDFLPDLNILLRLDGRDNLVLLDTLLSIKSLHKLQEERQILLQSARTGSDRRAGLDRESGGGDRTS
mmetsp:Transcript_45978/g.144206  ORF Transcript_45978/g.144206 Transcript_45978/m.144206 type:complete len:212 (+) Transcript_45978:396-1031(+)